MTIIFAALDESKNSRRVFTVALQLAKATQSRLVVASVVAVPSLESAPDYVVEERELVATVHEKILADAAKKAKKARVKVETLLLFGNPAEQLLRACGRKKVNYFVAGKRGAGSENAVKSLFVGDTFVELLHAINFPFLIVP